MNSRNENNNVIENIIARAMAPGNENGAGQQSQISDRVSQIDTNMHETTLRIDAGKKEFY